MDIGFVAYDLISLGYAFATDDEELFDQSLTDLAVDAASMAVPGMPGGSTHVTRAIDGRIIGKAGRTEFSERVKREIAEKGLYNPGRGEELHHIGEAGGKSQASKRVREMLEEAGIDVSGAENGVGLVHHKGRHRDQYARELVERLDALAPDKVKSEIKKIGQELREIDAGISDGSIKGRTGRYSPRPDTVREWVMRQEDKRRNK